MAEQSPPPISETWFEMGVPRAGIAHVMPESNEHGFYADYTGNDRAALLAEVSRGLEKAGYSRSCTALDGSVIGFSNGRRQLALKIDLLPNTYLSVFDEEGSEPLLHGLCYGRYHAGPAHVMTQAEKEAFAKQFEDDDVTATPSPVDRR